VSKLVSPYYPPRARWYHFGFDWAGQLRRSFRLRGSRETFKPSLFAVASGLLLPGCGFKIRFPGILGNVALLLCTTLVLIFFVWLGHPVSNAAFGLLLSVHVTGANFVVEPYLAHARLGYRIVFSLCWCFIILTLVYLPARNLLETHWFFPININGEVVVINRAASLRAVKRGDWIVYSIAENAARGVVVQAGYSLGSVLAVPGDHVQFTKGGFDVNGQEQARRQSMPREGDFVMPEKGWFIWPDLATLGHGHVDESEISAMFMRLAMVSEGQFAGKPFKRWFWHRQHLP